MSESQGGWSVLTASATGGRHRRASTPNQDAVAARVTPHGVVVAVADGHGGDRHVRSHLGARMAVEVACAASIATLADAALARSGSDLAGTILTEWRSMVDGHLARQPLTPDEQQRCQPSASPTGLRIAYGTTLLLALLSDHDGLLLQIGDGDVLVLVTDDAVETPVPSDARLIGSRTTSLCADEAEGMFRFAGLGERDWPPSLVLLATDGYGNAFVDPNWHHQAMHDFAEMLRHHDRNDIAEALPSWLAESAEVAGDDTTVGLVYRTDWLAGHRWRRGRRSGEGTARG